MKPSEIFDHVLIHAMFIYSLLMILLEVWPYFESTYLFILVSLSSVMIYLILIRKLFYRHILLKRFCLHVVINLVNLILTVLGNILIQFWILRILFGEKMFSLGQENAKVFLNHFDWVFCVYYLSVIVIVCSVYEGYYIQKRRIKFKKQLQERALKKALKQGDWY